MTMLWKVFRRDINWGEWDNPVGSFATKTEAKSFADQQTKVIEDQGIDPNHVWFEVIYCYEMNNETYYEEFMQNINNLIACKLALAEAVKQYEKTKIDLEEINCQIQKLENQATRARGEVK